MKKSRRFTLFLMFHRRGFKIHPITKHTQNPSIFENTHTHTHTHTQNKNHYFRQTYDFMPKTYI